MPRGKQVRLYGIVNKGEVKRLHTVVCVIAKGRNNELGAVLRFARDFTHWSGTSFEGRPSTNNRRLAQ